MLAVICCSKTFLFLWQRTHTLEGYYVAGNGTEEIKDVNKDVLMSHSLRILEVIKSLYLLKWKRYWYSLRSRLSTQQGCSSLDSFMFQLGVSS